ncbi:MAG: hypothetical protein CML66_26975 [Rhodobacteraceae bacterium]|nr:hypothetical protein [Paracoccaceae bacterium]MAY46087.1 hypothetical protein [Paracoccaceae bacterium]
MTGPLSSAQTETLIRLADVILPRHGRMPAASEIGLAARVVREALPLRPDLRTPLITALDEIGTQPARAWVEGCDRPFLTQVIELLAGAYYMDQQVMDILGFPGAPEDIPWVASAG